MAKPNRAEKVQIIPDVSLIGKLGARSRALPKVVTELVDNSVDSWMDMDPKLTEGKVFEVVIDPDEDFFEVTDNAGGMNLQALANAMRVAYSDKDKARIGSFGFGLKSACMYIGDRFHIYTMHWKEPGTVYHLHFDREAFEKQRDSKDPKDQWMLGIEVLTAAFARDNLGITFPDKHGTIIRIETKIQIQSNQKKAVARRLARVFSCLIDKHPEVEQRKMPFKFKETSRSINMRLIYDGTPLVAAGPFYERYLTPDSSDGTNPGKGAQLVPALDPRYLKEGWVVKIGPFTTESGKIVHGRAALIDRGMGHNNEYGFDLIKNGRVIEEDAMDTSDTREIGLLRNNSYARVVGQLILDDWQTDHQKTSFLRDIPEWEEVYQNVSSAIEKLIKESKKLQNPGGSGGKTKQVDTEKREQGIQKTVQRAARTSAMKNSLKKISSRDLPQNSRLKGKEDISRFSDSKLGQSKPLVHLENLGADAPLSRAQIKTEKGFPVVAIEINLDHPFLSVADQNQRDLLLTFISIDVQAEFFARSRNPTLSSFLELRETLLREVGSDR